VKIHFVENIFQYFITVNAKNISRPAGQYVTLMLYNLFKNQDIDLFLFGHIMVCFCGLKSEGRIRTFWSDPELSLHSLKQIFFFKKHRAVFLPKLPFAIFAIFITGVVGKKKCLTC